LFYLPFLLFFKGQIECPENFILEKYFVDRHFKRFKVMIVNAKHFSFCSKHEHGLGQRLIGLGFFFSFQVSSPEALRQNAMA
jgi:hypothetical protein